MKIYYKKNSRSKETVNSVPNAIAFTVIRNFISSKDFDEIRHDYFIKELNKNQISYVMNDIKWLFKNYKGLDVMTMEDQKGSITTFVI